MKDDIKSQIFRILKLIRLLGQKNSYTVPQLAKALKISPKSVYRHIDVLKDVGYQIESDEQNRYRLRFVVSSKESTLNSDEMEIINDVLQAHKSSNPFVESILQKINLNASLIPLADTLPNLHKIQLLKLISIAIDQGVCVKVKNYRSMTSGTMKDRLAEPLMLTEDNSYLIAWDIDEQRQSQFKLDRMDDIDILHDQKISSGHIPSPMDLFGLTGDTWTTVTLELKPFAYNILTESFNLSKQYIRKHPKDKQKVIFEAPILNWKGIGRFVLGLPDEIEVLAPQEFKDYLNKKIKKF